MATGKKFYGIKLRTSFLDSEKIDFLLSQKNGANYVDVENKNIRTAFTRKEFDKNKLKIREVAEKYGIKKD